LPDAKFNHLLEIDFLPFSSKESLSKKCVTPSSSADYCQEKKPVVVLWSCNTGHGLCVKKGFMFPNRS